MINQPGRVSVVIPVYNGAKYLRETIDSALRQTHSPIEIIVVDDGSTDTSAEVLASYGARITILRQSNQGVAAARNAGLASCTGEFIAFLDQDDVWQPAKIERQIQIFGANRAIGLVHTRTSYFDQAKSAVIVRENDARPSQLVGACFERLLLGNDIVNSSVVVRSDVLTRIGGCDPHIRGNTCQDYDLWLRAAQICEFGFVDAELTQFRVHSEQGQSNRRAMLEEELRVLFGRFPASRWRQTKAGRHRIGNLYDELAALAFDAGDPRKARHYFTKALTHNPTNRQFARFAVSCLPRPLANLIRAVAQSCLPDKLRGPRLSTNP